MARKNLWLLKGMLFIKHKSEEEIDKYFKKRQVSFNWIFL